MIDYSDIAKNVYFDNGGTNQRFDDIVAILSQLHLFEHRMTVGPAYS